MARVLVVDDSAELRELLRSVLESEGHSVLQASDGVAALEVPSNQYDVMLLDVMMPNMDGLMVLNKLGQSGKHLPRIIMLTAKSGELDRQMALRRGALGFITKPFNPDDVVAEISRVLRQSDEVLSESREKEIYVSHLLHLLERRPLRHPQAR
jgi:DNA-binding response OmpR family regulator